MKKREHKLGVPEVNLVVRHLKLESAHRKNFRQPSNKLTGSMAWIQFPLKKNLRF